MDLLLKGIKISINFILYYISFLIPRDKNIWVFGAWFGERYSDNPKYVYEYVSKVEKKIRPIWLTHDNDIRKKLCSKGYKVYIIRSFLGFWYSCRASVAIFNCALSVDVNPVGLSRAKKFQLWHGTPLKKIGYDDLLSGDANYKSNGTVKGFLRKILLPYMSTYDAIISPSYYVSNFLETAFRMDSSKVFVTGYPRGDVILSKDPQKIEIVEKLKLKFKPKKIIGYIPTHRQQGIKEFKYLSKEDIEKLNICLKKQDAIMLVKLHYYHTHEEGYKNLEGDSRIYFLKEEEVPDVNYLLPWLNCLITDYSSVYFDYLLLDRPVIFFPFDYNEYITKDRELYVDYNEVTPGEKCFTWDEIINELEKLESGIDLYVVKRKNVTKKYNDYIDTDNSKRVTDIAKMLSSKK